jgi:hypothetical protein
MKDISEKQFIKLVPFVFIVVLAGDILLGIYLKEIGVAIINGILTTALVLITGVYALHTKTMAEEMKEQRYDMFRPVIDIEEINSDLGPGYLGINDRQTTDDEKISTNPFECVLRNYGAGAAIDIYSVYEHIRSGVIRPSIGNIQANESKKIRSVPNDLKFIKAQKLGSQWFLVVYYRDVYGRCFETKRSVNLEGETFKIGSFTYRKLDKQKDNALINEIWPTSNSEVSQ